jgi:outer membrane lipoprotein SlyB
MMHRVMQTSENPKPSTVNPKPHNGNVLGPHNGNVLGPHNGNVLGPHNGNVLGPHNGNVLGPYNGNGHGYWGRNPTMPIRPLFSGGVFCGP